MAYKNRASERAAEWRQKNPERYRAYARSDAVRERNRDWMVRDRKEHPEKYKKKDRLKRHRHATSINAQKRKYRASHPRSSWGATLKRKYGLSAEQYLAMLAQQGGCCAICGKPETARWRGTLCRLSVDHDHTTGEIRGLTCRRCNSILGLAKDDKSILTRAIQYLQKHRRRQYAIRAMAG